MMKWSTSGNRLEPGDHELTISEMWIELATSPRRQTLMKCFETLQDLLVKAGVTEIWVCGSFVTDKRRPSDVDVVYVPPQGSGMGTLGIFALSNRAAIKASYSVDLWPFPSNQPSGETILDFFRTDRDGRELGVVKVAWENEEEEKHAEESEPEDAS